LTSVQFLLRSGMQRGPEILKWNQWGGQSEAEIRTGIGCRSYQEEVVTTKYLSMTT
jgi:hypothetical protein